MESYEDYIKGFNSKLNMLGVTEYYYSEDGKLYISKAKDILKLRMPNGMRQSDFNSIAFNTMTKLEYIIMPDTIEKIVPALFIKNKSLMQIRFSSSLTVIEENAFMNNSSILGLDFGSCENLRYIGFGAFKKCSKLESVVVPKELNYLGKDVFKGCTSIKELRLQAGNKLTDEFIEYSGINIGNTKVIRL